MVGAKRGNHVLQFEIFSDQHSCLPCRRRGQILFHHGAGAPRFGNHHFAALWQNESIAGAFGLHSHGVLRYAHADASIRQAGVDIESSTKGRYRCATRFDQKRPRFIRRHLEVSLAFNKHHASARWRIVYVECRHGVERDAGTIRQLQRAQFTYASRIIGHERA